VWCETSGFKAVTLVVARMAKRTIEHYEIVRRLGAGGSGVVFLATDTLLQRPVVLKILRGGIMPAEKLRTTVLREARLVSAIEHPNGTTSTRTRISSVFSKT
jgi:serine/threonine protein kinase